MLLAKSVYQVSVRLPQIKTISTLYPTQQMRAVVECLYSCILEFLLKAHEWLNESRFRHICHSITRPHALHFDDVLARVSSCSNDIYELAAVGSQAEIRVMHDTHTDALEGIVDIISRLEAGDKDRTDQLAGLADSVSRLEREHKENMGKIITLLQSSGLTVNDLLVKMESEYFGGNRSFYRTCLP